MHTLPYLIAAHITNHHHIIVWALSTFLHHTYMLHVVISPPLHELQCSVSASMVYSDILRVERLTCVRHVPHTYVKCEAFNFSMQSVDHSRLIQCVCVWVWSRAKNQLYHCSHGEEFRQTENHTKCSLKITETYNKIPDSCSFVSPSPTSSHHRHCCQPHIAATVAATIAVAVVMHMEHN